ncbi:hypothetical protein SAMN04488103_109176 [Gemmobacter aquatilis]|uniref:Uncharacterized protein n=1 Tax=Gemmobacter aquatilis TaxID=933059 RepID=A0A1H8KSB7_9RHOB|nr:hypothetical protein [Gemmobacter aquatilis]SEN95308.1 hypothetical protein SAMN04488103_109176 [Gemmobacter aquatilis]
MAVSSASTRLVAVDDASLPLYPISTGQRLETHYFTVWHHRRWLRSEFRGLADREVRAVGLDLFFSAQDEDPVGTLPVDERMLAKLVAEPLDVWRALVERQVSPLYGWRRCRTDRGALRWYHPVVLEVVQAALGSREDHLARRASERERKRLEALPGQIVRAGGGKRLAEDQMYLIRLDQFC